MGPHIGYDTVTPSEFRRLIAPPGNPMVALGGYPDGLFNDIRQIRAEYPQCVTFDYAVRSGDDGDGLDIERGDATPPEFPGWFHRQTPRVFAHPFGYCSASVMDAVISAMAADGIPRSEYLLMSAHYGIGPHICAPHICGFPQADMTQWTDTGPHGENVDRILFGDHVWHPSPPVHASGIAVARLAFDSTHFRWSIEHQHGSFKHGDRDEWVSAEVQHNQQSNHWRVHPMAMNAKPLGG